MGNLCTSMKPSNHSRSSIRPTEQGNTATPAASSHVGGRQDESLPPARLPASPATSPARSLNNARVAMQRSTLPQFADHPIHPYRNLEELFQVLLESGEKAGAILKAYPQVGCLQDNGGRTALMKAAVTGHEELTRLLLEHGAQRDMLDQEGNSALMLAIDGWKNGEPRCMLVAMRLIKLKESEKFKFAYSVSQIPTQNQSVQERLLGKHFAEDNFALKTLHSDRSKKAVAECARRCAAHIASVVPYNNSDSDSDSDKDEDFGETRFIQTVNEFLAEKRGDYPTLKQDFGSFQELLSFLNHSEPETDNNRHVKQLSVLWFLSLCIPPADSDAEMDSEHSAERNMIYDHLIKPTQDFCKTVKSPPVNTQFGNSGKVFDATFADHDFTDFSRINTYGTINQQSSSYRVQNFLKKQTTYGSGLSGMANASCGLADILKLDIRNSELGKDFCEVIAAFIVGAGMHSYPEVYKTFNLHLKLLEARALSYEQ